MKLHEEISYFIFWCVFKKMVKLKFFLIFNRVVIVEFSRAIDRVHDQKIIFYDPNFDPIIHWLNLYFFELNKPKSISY
jgi:hypothetical protein